MYSSGSLPSFSSELPDIDLFHYTDANGFLGMVRSNKLWMTNIHYQNDAKEYYYAIDLLKKVILEDYPNLINSVNIKALRNRISSAFSFSLSEKKDLLSQWRGYCPNGGFSICFDKQSLQRTMRENELKIVKCIYDIDDQKEFIRKNIIEFTPEEYRATGPSPSKANTLFYEIFDKVAKYAPVLKHKSFKAEKEWRLIKNLTPTADRNENKVVMINALKNFESIVRFRSKKNTVIPYIEIPLLYDVQKKVTIKKVVISPTNLPSNLKELAKDACKAALALDNYPNEQTEVKYSKTPYTGQ